MSKTVLKILRVFVRTRHLLQERQFWAWVWVLLALQLTYPILLVVQGGVHEGLTWYRNEPAFSLWGLPIFPLAAALLISKLNPCYVREFRRPIKYTLLGALGIALVWATFGVYADKNQSRHPARPYVMAEDFRPGAYWLDRCMRRWAWNAAAPDDCGELLQTLSLGTVAEQRSDSCIPDLAASSRDPICLDRAELEAVVEDRGCPEFDAAFIRADRGCWAEAIYRGFIAPHAPRSVWRRSASEITALFLTFVHVLFVVVFVWYLAAMVLMLLVDSEKVQEEDRNTGVVIFVFLVALVPLKLYAEWYQFFYDLRTVGAYQAGVTFVALLILSLVLLALLFTPSKPLRIVNAIIAIALTMSSLVAVLKPEWLPPIAHSFESLQLLFVGIFAVIVFLCSLVLILRVAQLDLTSWLQKTGSVLHRA